MWNKINVRMNEMKPISEIDKEHAAVQNNMKTMMTIITW